MKGHNHRNLTWNIAKVLQQRTREVRKNIEVPTTSVKEVSANIKNWPGTRKRTGEVGREEEREEEEEEEVMTRRHYSHTDLCAAQTEAYFERGLLLLVGKQLPCCAVLTTPL